MNAIDPIKAPKPMSISPPGLVAAAIKVKQSGVPLPNARNVAPASLVVAKIMAEIRFFSLPYEGTGA